MTYGKTLEDYGVTDIDDEQTSEDIRNEQYKEIMKDITKRQMEVYWEIYKHPEGITTKRIATILRRSLHGISGRLTELSNPKGYDRNPYCNPPLIVKCGTGILPNDLGQMTKYSKFKVCNGFDNSFLRVDKEETKKKVVPDFPISDNSIPLISSNAIDRRSLD